MADVILDAFLDSLKVLAVVAVCTYIIAFIEPLLSKRIRLHGKLAPLIGVSISLLPQCGFSIVAADLYQKRHLTIGTLIGVFLATSDEALPVFLSYPNKALHVLPILLIKFLLGLIIGYSIDFIFSKSRKSVTHHVKHCNDDYRIRLMHCDSAERVEKTEITECCSCEECSVSECSKNATNNAQNNLDHCD
ncbi:MAG: arsenic efflux protein, partial [Clostridia bacterium]|nr:arsenic efflux protein [Clostridia bacterium]